MENSYLVIFLFLPLSKDQCVCGFNFTHGPASSYDEAVRSCETAGGHLVLPTSSQHSTELDQYMTGIGLTSSWVDTKITVGEWSYLDGADRVLLFDQGCFSESSLAGKPPQTFTYAQSVQECANSCNRKSKRISALQRRDSVDSTGSRCGCYDHVPTSGVLHERSCRHECRPDQGDDLCGGVSGSTSSFRLLAKQGVRVTSSWDTTQNTGDNDFCLAYYRSGGIDTAITHNIVAKSCFDQYPSLCSTQGVTAMTWFDALTKCRALGGDLFDDDTVNYMTSSRTEDTNYWTDISRIWVDMRVTYANWAGGNPSTDRGECVFVSSSGRWESTSCTSSHPYVCRLIEFSNETRTKTGTIATTKATTATKIPVVTSAQTSYGVSTVNGEHMTTKSTSSPSINNDFTNSPLETSQTMWTTSGSTDKHGGADGTSEVNTTVIAVGVAVGVVALATVCVILCLLIRRREGPTIENIDPTYFLYDKEGHLTSGTAPGEITSYEDVGLSSQQKHTSSDLKKGNYPDTTEENELPAPAIYAEPNTFTHDVTIVENDLYGDTNITYDSDEKISKEVSHDSDVPKTSTMKEPDSGVYSVEKA